MGELSKEYEGRVEFLITSAKTPAGQAAIKKYEIDARQHGLVGFDRNGEVLVRMSGHNFTKADIKEEVETLLE
ncbi:MAG: hypothetical protein ACYTGZ_17900 [Planctomycetota bacterium]